MTKETERQTIVSTASLRIEDFHVNQAKQDPVRTVFRILRRRAKIAKCIGIDGQEKNKARRVSYNFSPKFLIQTQICINYVLCLLDPDKCSFFFFLLNKRIMRLCFFLPKFSTFAVRNVLIC